MALDFSHYLDVSIEDIPKKLPDLPLGHYYATIIGGKGEERFYQGKGGPGTPVYALSFKITAADDDVENPDNITVAGKIVSKDYNLVEGGGTFLRNLAEDTLKLDTKGLHLSDVLDAMKGQECKVYNKGRSGTGENEGRNFPNITNVFGLD